MIAPILLGHSRIRRRHRQRPFSSAFALFPECSQRRQQGVVGLVRDVEVAAPHRGVHPDPGAFVALVGQRRHAVGGGAVQPDLGQFSVHGWALIVASASRNSLGSRSAAVRICLPALMRMVR